MTDFKYIFKMSWYKSKRHIKSHTDMYYKKEEHTRWGHSNPLCRIMVVKVSEDSNEYKQAIYRSNSIILVSQLCKEKEEEEFWRGWEEAGRPKLRCRKPEEKP